MGPKSGLRKGNKAGNRKPGRRDVGRSPISVAPVVRTVVPTTPIPALTASVSPPELKILRTASGSERTVKKWCFDNTPVYYAPEEPWPSTSLNRGAIVEVTGEKKRIFVADVKTSWSEIVYKVQEPQSGVQWVKGWVNDAYLDDYNDRFPDSGLVIPNPTQDPKDAQQYMIWEGKVRYNLCGELSVAFIVNDDIDSVLTKWKKNSPTSYNAILGAGRDNTTSENDLKNLLCAVLGEYGYGSDGDQLISLRTQFTYPVSPGSMLQDLQKMLATHSLIAGVTINDTGELIGKEHPRIKHWVVLDRITRNGSRVEIYNPFPNKVEEYSFAEFYRSCSTMSGLWVKRKKARPVSAARDLPMLKVAIANPNPLYRAAQYIDVDGKKKTNLCGEFCTAFIVQESINAVLARWKEVQPFLYADIVGNNKGTGTFALKTILQSYGYNNEGDIQEFAAGLTDPYLKKSLLSPGRIAKMLETYFLIAGVNIEGLTGKLKPGNDVRHWVVVDKLTPVGKSRGWVELYNPFPNSWEEYSYKEFTDAVGYWSGLWVKRNIIPLYVPQVVHGSNIEDRPGEPVRIGQWTEGQLLAAIQRKSKSAKSLNKIVAELVELSGWKRRDIISRLRKILQTGKAGVWTETRLRQEIEERLKSGKPLHKISADLVKASGWKKRDVVSVLERLLESQKWTEAQLLAAVRQKLQATRSVNKIVAELADRSGWQKREVIGRIRKLIEAQRWPEAQLQAEIARRLKEKNPVSKIASRLAQASGWKVGDVVTLLKNILEAQKWTEPQLLAALREKLQVAQPMNKIATELAEVSGWGRQSILKRLKTIKTGRAEMVTKTGSNKETLGQLRNEKRKNKSKKWTEAQLLAEIQKRLKGTASENKIASELAGRSGWKQHEILSRVKRLKETQKWSEVQLRAEIRKRLLAGDSVSKIYARLTELSGWKRREVVAIVKQVQEAEKWTEAQLLAAIREKLKSTRSVNKIAADLEKPSGWKKHEILVRLKRLVAAEKWSKAQVHAEIQKRLEAGNSASKISKELAAISGWKSWEISRILKVIREQAKDAEKKNRVVIEDETIVPPDPSTIVHASKRRAEYLQWQDQVLSAPGSKLRKVRRWGDPVMIAQAGYSVDIVGTTNFQAVKLWSPEGGWGGVTNFLSIPHEHVLKLAGMQIEDEFVAKKPGWSEGLNMPAWLGQKMSWLCKEDGTIYMRASGWRRADSIRWGTIALGGNLVAVEGIEVVTLKLPRETTKREVAMARLKGFRASDWDRPLDELLAEGLVHRCFCAYKNDHFGDSPKGIVYSPFYSPLDWDFAGNVQPKAFYIPVDWLAT